MTPWWGPAVWLTAGALVFILIGWLFYREWKARKARKREPKS